MPEEDREIWFPAKRYGWGWGLPCVWQGWMVLGAYTIMLLIGALTFDSEQDTVLFVGWVTGWTVLLLVVTWVKGERPRWRWGDSKRG